MNAELYPFIALILIVFGLVFYLNLGPKKQKFYKEGESFKDEYGDYFVQDIEKLVEYVEALPKENQINIYENLAVKFGNYEKEISKLNSPRKVNKTYKKYLLDASVLRRKNADVNLSYEGLVHIPDLLSKVIIVIWQEICLTNFILQQKRI